ncbi:MAG: DNA-binding response regulator [Acidimicrobiales bacterium]|nr:DNA-binding response regulator [Acidimicrobiales bacterium]
MAGNLGVLIAVDDRRVRAAARDAVLAADGLSIVGEVANGLDAVCHAAIKNPAIVVLDVASDGLRALPATKRTAPDARILVLSGRERDDGLQALAWGADACLHPLDLAHLGSTLLALAKGYGGAS